MVGDVNGYLRIFDYVNDKMIDCLKFYDNMPIDFIVKDHETINNMFVIASKKSNKFWVTTLRSDLESNTLLVIGHDYFPMEDTKGQSIGEIDEVGFVEMSSDVKSLLISTTNLILINIEV